MRASRPRPSLVRTTVTCARSTMADLRAPRLVVSVALAAILIGVAGAQDAPKVDDLISAVERGDADAQWQLGDTYHHGRGVTQDDAEALRLYRAAADQGSPAGQWRLGNACLLGRGVAQDDAEAVRWYRAAAEQGNAESQLRLGPRYAPGRGVRWTTWPPMRGSTLPPRRATRRQPAAATGWPGP